MRMWTRTAWTKNGGTVASVHSVECDGNPDWHVSGGSNPSNCAEQSEGDHGAGLFRLLRYGRSVVDDWADQWQTRPPLQHIYMPHLPITVR
jgi:hypothetical protein